MHSMADLEYGLALHDLAGLSSLLALSLATGKASGALGLMGVAGDLNPNCFTYTVECAVRTLCVDIRARSVAELRAGWERSRYTRYGSTVR